MNIVLLEPFFSGSHQQWAEGLQLNSKHEIEILHLPGRHWKWRMHGGAITLAKRFHQLQTMPDLIIASDMLDLGLFLSLTRRKTAQIPVAIYFHENQLTYPWSPIDRDVKNQRDNHYSFINYATALAADQIWFNSNYHQEAFLGALPNFLKQFPDHQGQANTSLLAGKSQVLPLGINLKRFDAFQKTNPDPVGTLLWNHRWEYDKDPVTFFKALFELQDRGVPFHLVVLGEQNEMQPPIFAEARKRLEDRIVHWGYEKKFEDYAHWLWQADILPVTSQQDFFGGSVVEAMYCNCMPLLPHRLAYPEHVPQSLQDQYFYENQDELVSRLKIWLLNIEALREQSVQPLVVRYDWTQVINEYDQSFEAMLTSTS